MSFESCKTGYKVLNFMNILLGSAIIVVLILIMLFTNHLSLSVEEPLNILYFLLILTAGFSMIFISGMYFSNCSKIPNKKRFDM